MSHYYTNDPKLKDEFKTININIKNKDFVFKTNSGVFSKDNLDFGSRLLIETITIDDKVKKIADIGSGYGPIGIITASLNPNTVVHLYEINERAINLSKENAYLNNVNNVLINHNNILENVLDSFDVILTNPPIRAGKKIVFEFYSQAYKHLNKGGCLYVVIQKKQGAPSTFNYLSEKFENVTVLTKNKGYWIIKATK